ncbi:carboxylesterase/lipase family protein [Streptomyces sp. NPDC088387]|uniref:carboxylesterase/lipase family protein n=1 Tax=Streptomyces sp. NPDC088387 TaxID=3365859 RepID=UPI003828A6C9
MGVAAALSGTGAAEAGEGSAAKLRGGAPVVRTGQGRLEGFTESGTNKFLGVPFARPPVGELRWQAPRRPAAWSGVRKAQAFGPAAYQSAVHPSFRTDRMSEDCLYLNVWTNSLSEHARQPVVVWFHGGGYTGGSASEMFTDGTNLAKLGVTVVAPNYRLGPFGYLNDDELGTNFAVLDNVAALQWVHDNIEAFGGDPSRVLVFGYSAGAGVVRNLLRCPQAKGLFQRCMIQSVGGEPPVSTRVWTPERSRTASQTLLEKLGTKDRSELARIPSRVIHETALTGPVVRPPAGGFRTPLDLVWMPVPDDRIVMADSYPAWSRNLPVVFSSCQNEARYFMDVNKEYTPETLSVMIDHLAGPKAEQARRIIDSAGSTELESLDRLFTTVVWWESEYASLRRFLEEGRTLYSYRFQRISQGREQNNRLALHGTDIFYLFGNLLDNEFYEGAPYDETDRRISHEMQHAFVEFARTGVPKRVDGARWPKFGASRSLQTVVGDEVSFAPYDVDPLIETFYSLRQPN